jgi:hypothetical protein
LYALGLNIGTYLNEAFDNNVFVFLFRRVQTLELIKPENYNKFKFYMKIMYKTFHSGMKLTKEENTLLDELSVMMGQQFTEKKLREHANIIKRMIKNGPDHDIYKHTVEMFEKIDRKCQLENKPLESKWGWKAPNSHIIMTTLHKLYPKMKYIMVIRSGLDMAFSSNRNQLELWGESVFQPENMVDPNWADSPRLTLKYWCMVHKKILSEAKQMNHQFYLLKYEDICFDTENAISKLLQFLEVPPDQKLIDSLGKLVETSCGVGRFRNKTKYELAQLDPEDVAYVEELGFPIN